MVPKEIKIAFDVDGTLITQGENGRDIPNYNVIQIYRWFAERGYFMVVWSGSGRDYATTWAEKLGLKPNACLAKPIGKSGQVDIAFDDQDVELGVTNIKV